MAIEKIYEKEVMYVVQPGTYMGIWQIHGLASILGTDIRSVHPGAGLTYDLLNRIVKPRPGMKVCDQTAHIMWTSLDRSAPKRNWFQPNHFVPLLRKFPLPANESEHRDEVKVTVSGFFMAFLSILVQ